MADLYTQTPGQFSATAQLVLNGILQQLQSLEAGFEKLDNNPPNGTAKAAIVTLLNWVIANYVDPAAPIPPPWDPPQPEGD